MKVTILGSGTSTGIPVIGCSCKVCRSRNPKNKRLRASAWFEVDGRSILIDTSVDLRSQALAHKIGRVDAVLSHPHADHIHGIDELRCYNFLQKTPIPVYGNDWTCRDLKVKFPYVFNIEKPEGGGIPQLELNLINARIPSFQAAGVEVIPISHSHGSQECLGYRMHSVAYVTDCSYIPPESLDRMKGLSVLILDCVRLKPHRTHFNLDQALETVNQVKPRRTFLTHLGHDFEHSAWSRKLPRGVALAYDGLKIRI